MSDIRYYVFDGENSLEPKFIGQYNYYSEALKVVQQLEIFFNDPGRFYVEQGSFVDFED